MRKTKNLTIAEMPEDDAKEIKEILDKALGLRDKALGREELSSVIRRIREEELH